jgi:hypothetical protein
MNHGIVGIRQTFGQTHRLDTSLVSSSMTKQYAKKYANGSGTLRCGTAKGS